MELLNSSEFKISFPVISKICIFINELAAEVKNKWFPFKGFGYIFNPSISLNEFDDKVVISPVIATSSILKLPPAASEFQP